MNTLVVLACVVAVAFGAPVHEEAAPFDLKQHADVDGSYTFTYASEDASKTESRNVDGAIRGAYSYIDSDGVLQKVQYIADENGFQAYGTNLPVGSTVPVKETSEVLEATADHFARVDEHQKKVAIAAKLHAEFRSAHPELFNDEQHVVPVAIRVVPVHHIEVPARREIIHHVHQEVPHQVEYHHHHAGHVAVLEEDEEVKLARALHLAEVERVKAEHFAALAAAPRVEE